MSLPEINYVEITEENDSFIYEIHTKECCIGNIAIVLSKVRKADSAYVVEGKSEWHNSVGTVTVLKEKLKDVSDLYVYLKDQGTSVTGTPVMVYYEALSLKAWHITKNMELTLLPDRGKSAYEFSKKLVLSYKDMYGNEQRYMLDMPNARIGLEKLDLWEDSQDFTFQLGYYMEDEGAEIHGAYSPQISVYIAPPQINQTVFSDGKVDLYGEFARKELLRVQVYRGSQLWKEVDAKDGTVDISKLCVDESEGLSLIPYYQTDYGRSLYGDKVEVILGSPVVESCVLRDGKWTVCMERSGTYSLSYNEKDTQIITGKQFRIPQEVMQFQLRYFSRCGEGPIVVCKLKERAVYAFAQGDRVFYLACDRPDEWMLNADISVGLCVKASEGRDYAGAYFQLGNAGEKTVLTIKGEIFNADTEPAHEDYRKLMQKIAPQRELFAAVRDAVVGNLPMRAEEMLFYYYEHCPESGYVGICEGMSLMTEYTVYQNIPGAKQSNADLNGFVGTGTARYQVVRRDGKLKIEPFAAGMNFVVSPPKDMGSDNKLCGGAGVADLLYSGFSAEYMRLVYPARFTDRNSEGNLCYDRNICLLSSGSMDSLVEATEHMRAGGVGVNGCSYHYFRGRSVVVPQICVRVCGGVHWVSLGTLLSDIQESMGLASCSLYRMVNGERLPVKYKDARIPLVAGDCIET